MNSSTVQAFYRVVNYVFVFLALVGYWFVRESLIDDVGIDMRIRRGIDLDYSLPTFSLMAVLYVSMLHYYRRIKKNEPLNKVNYLLYIMILIVLFLFYGYIIYIVKFAVLESMMLHMGMCLLFLIWNVVMVVFLDYAK
ncbi:hypothetical protein [Metabacillus iocasae]|uniref:Membrane-associated HD superfamily phosphohydrolase n=1 Tax=Priestia iocasae TaxID=2291674 RepID=A0ABS2R0T4_9BACI|nr:hypothetical protein [Metabacillus iocasae]MBM7704359.1 membrane-associated HD superfamily phosphohydrolase [Metabacillus iocasae]